MLKDETRVEFKDTCDRNIPVTYRSNVPISVAAAASSSIRVAMCLLEKPAGFRRQLSCVCVS